MVTHSPPTSEVGGSTLDPMWESWGFLTDGRQFTVQKLDQLYVQFPLPITLRTRCDMTCTALKKRR